MEIIDINFGAVGSVGNKWADGLIRVGGVLFTKTKNQKSNWGFAKCFELLGKLNNIYFINFAVKYRRNKRNFSEPQLNNSTLLSVTWAECTEQLDN